MTPCWTALSGWAKIPSSMESETFQRCLQAFLRRVPFQPFTVELVNGVRLRVEQPETVALNGGLAVHIASDGAPTFFDASGVADLAGAVAGSLGSSGERPRVGFA
jgi:hypothetical protein